MSMCWAQMASEEELWTSIMIPAVTQGYTVAVLLEAVRIWWDDHNGILLPKMVYDQYILVYTCMYSYVLVYTSIYCDILYYVVYYAIRLYYVLPLGCQNESASLAYDSHSTQPKDVNYPFTTWLWRILLSSAAVQPVPGSARLSALSGKPNSSCRFSPIHSASFVGNQRRTGCAVL